MRSLGVAAALMLIVAGLAWMYPTRAVRAQTLSLRERAYIDVARLNGIGGVRLVLTEIVTPRSASKSSSSGRAYVQCASVSLGLRKPIRSM
mgnify:CR=1 FL=1